MIEWCVFPPSGLRYDVVYRSCWFICRISINCKLIYEVIDATRDAKHGSAIWFEQKYPSRLPINSQQNAFCRLRYMREIKVGVSEVPFSLKPTILSLC
jgi:hypothetical protein